MPSNKLWKKNSNKRKFSLPAINTTGEIIKLSTVNGSGIYLPPSPSDEYNRNENYFDLKNSPTTLNHFPCYHTNRQEKEEINFYTPSSHLNSPI